MNHTLPLEEDQEHLWELLNEDYSHLDGPNHHTIVLRAEHGGDVAGTKHASA